MLKQKHLRLLIAAMLFLAAFWYFGSKNETPKDESKVQEDTVPAYVIEVLDFVSLHQKAPEGYVGGRTFYNREQKLPKTMDNQAIQYQEWDVHPKKAGQNRGAERLVTGSNKAAYYTPDHYKTFISIP